MKSSRGVVAVIMFALVSGMLLFASCGGGGGSGGGGIGEGNVTITMTANPGSIKADGVSSTIISITVNESAGGPAVPGTEVRLKTGDISICVKTTFLITGKA